MRKLALGAAALVTMLAATPALALAEGSFHVRNQTGEAQSCSIRHAGSNYAAPIMLRADGEWRAVQREGHPAQSAEPAWNFVVYERVRAA